MSPGHNSFLPCWIWIIFHTNSSWYWLRVIGQRSRFQLTQHKLVSGPYTFLGYLIRMILHTIVFNDTGVIVVRGFFSLGLSSLVTVILTPKSRKSSNNQRGLLWCPSELWHDHHPYHWRKTNDIVDVHGSIEGGSSDVIRKQPNGEESSLTDGVMTEAELNDSQASGRPKIIPVPFVSGISETTPIPMCIGQPMKMPSQPSSVSIHIWSQRFHLRQYLLNELFHIPRIFWGYMCI